MYQKKRPSGTFSIKNESPNPEGGDSLKSLSYC